MADKVSWEGVSVFIAMPTHRPIYPWTILPLIVTVQACMQLGIKVNVAMPYAASVVTSARNHVAHLFLQSDYQYLFWIDSDMEWQVKDFLKVLAATVQKDVVRVAYPARQEPLVFDADGLGFACVSRKVMEELAEKRPMIFYGDHAPCRAIFYEARGKSKNAEAAGAEFEFLAEDTMFFHDIRELGYETWLDPDVELGHVGEKVYRGSLKNDLMHAAEDSKETVAKLTELIKG